MTVPQNLPEVIVFNARFSGRKNVKNVKNEDKPYVAEANSSHSQEKVFNIKRSRYEVIRYGMTGFDKEHQMNSKIAMAIRLGAKPPKKKCINYKELMEVKRKEKEESMKNENKNQYILQPLKQKKKKSGKKKIKKQPSSIV